MYHVHGNYLGMFSSHSIGLYIVLYVLLFINKYNTVEASFICPHHTYYMVYMCVHIHVSCTVYVNMLCTYMYIHVHTCTYMYIHVHTCGTYIHTCST